MDHFIENKWLKLVNISSDQIKSFSKKDIHFRKHTGIGFLIAELDFITNPSVGTQIIVNLPDLKGYNFAPTENTVFALKNDRSNVIVKISMYPGYLQMEAYPFDGNSLYEFNIQFFVRLEDI